MLPVSRTTHKRRLLQKPFTRRSTYDRQANKNRYFLFRLKICYILYISTNYSEYISIVEINCCPPPTDFVSYCRISQQRHAFSPVAVLDDAECRKHCAL